MGKISDELKKHLESMTIEELYTKYCQPAESIVCPLSNDGIHVTSLTIYPVKGCREFPVRQWPMHEAGLYLDRHWCIKSMNSGKYFNIEKQMDTIIIHPYVDLINKILILAAPGMDKNFLQPIYDNEFGRTEGSQAHSMVMLRVNSKCLNETNNHGLSHALEKGSSYLQWDTDEQLLFNQGVRTHSICFNGSKKIRLYFNQPTSLDFETCASTPAIQELTKDDLKDGHMINEIELSYDCIVNNHPIGKDLYGDYSIVYEITVAESQLALAQEIVQDYFVICLGCTFEDCGDEAALWVNDALNMSDCRLLRQVQLRTNKLSMASDSHIQIMNISSLKDLSKRIAQEQGFMTTSLSELCLRFRPNIVVGGLEKYDESRLKDLSIRGIQLKCGELVERCKAVNLDLERYDYETYPLKYLVKAGKGKALFGLHTSVTNCNDNEIVHVGDKITVHSYK